MAESPPVLYESADRVATLTLNRPERLNTIVPALIEAFDEALARAIRDPEVHAIRLKGAGPHVLRRLRHRLGRGDDGAGRVREPVGPDPRLPDDVALRHSYMSLWRSPKPVIAQVHGFCVGGGTDFALCSDLIVCAEDCRIGYPPARVWGSPTTAMWIYRVGLERSKRLLLTGDPVDGRTAVEWGLASEAVPEPELDEAGARAREARRAAPPNQLHMMKLLVNQAYEQMGLHTTQLIGTLLDGSARHTPEGIDSRARAMEDVGARGRRTRRAVRRLRAGEALASTSLDKLVARFDHEVFDPGARVVIRLATDGADPRDVVLDSGGARLEPAGGNEPHASLTADTETWASVVGDAASGMEAFRRGRLRIRRNLHLGIGVPRSDLGLDGPGPAAFVRGPDTSAGAYSALEAGTGPPILMLHGLGGTKASFLPTIAALAPSFRTIAVDLLGFGDSDKPLGASYGPQFQARGIAPLLDALELERAHFIGHSMGGRVALELGFRHPERTIGLVLMTPAMAWLRERRWAPYLRWIRPELGLLQIAPRAIVEAFMRRAVPGSDTPWGASAIDEFSRIYTTARGRAALYAAARNIYLEEPHGDEGFWTRLEALAPESLFIWGSHDRLVPAAFMRHVERALPAAQHLELNSGHLPQFERPRETHAAIARFLAEAKPAAAPSTSSRASRRSP